MTLNIKGREVIINANDYNLISQYKWHISSTGYAVWRGIKDGRKQTIRMHRLINNTPKDIDTDHINRNRLDNRRSNLRNCTPKENSSNSSRVLNQNGYWYDRSKGNWQVNGNNNHPKRRRFSSEKEAKEYVKTIL